MTGWVLIIVLMAVWTVGYVYGVFVGMRAGKEIGRVQTDAEWQAIL